MLRRIHIFPFFSSLTFSVWRFVVAAPLEANSKEARVEAYEDLFEELRSMLEDVIQDQEVAGA